MASLDVDSLSTNVLLEKTINIVLMSYSKVIVAFMVLKKKKTNYRDAFFNYEGIDYFV